VYRLFMVTLWFELVFVCVCVGGKLDVITFEFTFGKIRKLRIKIDQNRIIWHPSEFRIELEFYCCNFVCITSFA
jgi:hypothetical protein